MINSVIGSVLNMSADIYIQKNVQSTDSGNIYREWAYDKTIKCKIEPYKSRASSKSTNKSFDNNGKYLENMHLKMRSTINLSKRWRVSGIRSSNGGQVFMELDKYNTPDTIFEVIESHTMLDPLGRISYYEIILQRVQVQSDNTQSE